MVIYNLYKVNICKSRLFKQFFQLLVSTEALEEQTGMAVALILRLFPYSDSKGGTDFIHCHWRQTGWVCSPQ